MKYFFYLLLITTICISCESKKNNKQAAAALAKATADTANYTEILWLDSVANFGTINMGEKIEVKFRFKNVGTKPLLLTQVQAGCGCTTPDYTKEPVAPGKEGWVTGIFDSNNQRGEVHKYINVRSNTRNGIEHKLLFTGLVNTNDAPKEPVKSN